MRKIFLCLTLCLMTVGLNAACRNMQDAEKRIVKSRVLIDNDFCGDPDGMFQLTHQLLCATCDIRGIVGSNLPADDILHYGENQARLSCDKAREVIRLLQQEWRNIPVVEGARIAMESDMKPIDSEGARLIIREARLCSKEKPLVVLAGAGLTNVATACMLAPDIAERILLLWIGGKEYDDFGFYSPPGHGAMEYNLSISPYAGQVVFNNTMVRIWQVPRDAYRQCLYSIDEIAERIRPCGAIGQYLYDELMATIRLNENMGKPMGEVYVLGDSPLVLLSSLQTGYAPDAASSRYKLVACPILNADGTYTLNPDGRQIRVYTQLDVRLMLADFEAKLRNFK